MPDIKKHILAICGSTRKQSSNLDLIKVITELAKEQFSITIFEHLADIPHFNPDLDTENPPEQVNIFRQRLQEADGILICSPEYAMGVPGTLKNAIDWTVSSSSFSHKPVALITASSMGEKAHASLLGTLKIIEADIRDTTQLLVPFIKAKMNKTPEITDEGTLEKVKELISAFAEIVKRP
jgi:chromate reductase